MPTYGYICEKCGYEFDEFQSITAKPLRKCPECGRNSLKRLIGAGAGFIFKGSGFYQTDYRSEGYKKAAEKEKKGPDTSAASTASVGTAGKAGSADSAKNQPKAGKTDKGGSAKSKTGNSSTKKKSA